MNRLGFFFFVAAIGLSLSSAVADSDDVFSSSTDPLAQRDEWGVLGQDPLNITDFEPRDTYRFYYYFKSSSSLTSDPAYVGALQTALRRRGYYAGPIDGYFSTRLGNAIARLQKAYALHVTGTLTIPVRRTLHLP